MSHRLPVILTLSLLSVILALACTAIAAEEEKQEASAEDRYVVPEGDAAALAKFIDELVAYKPKTTEEQLARREHLMKSLQTAADRILELDKDPTSAPHRKAEYTKLQLRLGELVRGSDKEQREFYQDLSKYMKTAKELTQPDMALAFTAGQLIERSGNTTLAAEVYSQFGETFSKATDADLASYGEKMKGVARRLDLVGKEMEIKGATLSGEPFNWKSYQGKVVLVDYWATWCGPCIGELPNVLENYAKYHDKGFEVVGISLDEDRERLMRFVEAREIPWVTLFEDGAGWNHPMAMYYGVMSIPATMLVDREGKVVSLNARGGELGRQLARLLGDGAVPESGE